MKRTTISTTIAPKARALVAMLGLLAACAAQTQAAGDPAQPAASGSRSALLDFRSCAKPAYPDEEQKANHEGTVTLGFLVKADGSVGDTKVIASSGFPALDEEARSALARCRFSPAVRGGQPVDAWTQVQYVWSSK
jgi:TonB family protein